MANNLFDSAWASDLAALEQRQKLAAAAEAARAARAARSGGTTVLNTPTARPVNESFPINPFYTTAATDYLVPSRSGEAVTGVVVSPLAQDPRFKLPPSSKVASLLAGDAVMSMTKEALADTPQNALKKSIDAGAQVAQDKNQQREQSGFLSTLLGNVNWQKLLSTLARPELQQAGISPASAFVNAAFAQSQAEAGAAAARQQQMVDLQKEMIKKSGTGAEKLTGSVLQVIENTALASDGLQAINAYRQILQESQVGGIAGKGEEAINAVASLFGLGSLTPAQKAAAVRQRILAALQTAQAKGQISTSDYQNIEKQLRNPGEWLTTSDALFEQLDIVQNQLEAKQQLGRNVLTNFGINPQSVSSFRSPLTVAKRPD